MLPDLFSGEVIPKMIGLQPILARQPTDFTAEFCERILPVQAHIRHERDVTDDRQSCSLAIEFKPTSDWRPLDSATARRIGTTWSNECRNTDSTMTTHCRSEADRLGKE